jgi:lysophospholipase L1-like esterase
MKKSILVSIIYLALISCTKKESTPMTPPVVNSVVNTDTTLKTFLALGDSYTIGQSVMEYERFPNQTVTKLKNLHFNFLQPDIIATTGWTTSDLINALNKNIPQHVYSVVSILIGVNNQYQGKSLTQYKTEFTELLNRAVIYANNKPGHVFVLSIPDYSVTPFARGSDIAKIAREIDEFNAANKEISFNAGVHYLDITDVSRQAKTSPSLIATDGLHPSGEQYEKWAALLTPLIADAIK